ncbi:MAG: hypothetical protein V6Z78_02510 [Holosporaceae bacterium]
MLLAEPMREEVFVGQSALSTPLSPIVPNRYERLSQLSKKFAKTTTSWCQHKQQQASHASAKAAAFAMPWLVYGKDQVVAGSFKAAAFAMPWLVYGKDQVVAGSFKAAAFAMPWLVYGKDKMSEGLKEAHDKARATLFPSAQSIENNKRFAQIEKPRVMDFSKKMTVQPKPHPKNRLNARQVSLPSKLDKSTQVRQKPAPQVSKAKAPRKRKSPA